MKRELILVEVRDGQHVDTEAEISDEEAEAIDDRAARAIDEVGTAGADIIRTALVREAYLRSAAARRRKLATN